MFYIEYTFLLFGMTSVHLSVRRPDMLWTYKQSRGYTRRHVMRSHVQPYVICLNVTGLRHFYMVQLSIAVSSNILYKWMFHTLFVPTP